MTETIEIALEEIDLATAYMPRDHIDFDVIDEYKINIDDLPPILVAIGTGSKPYILIDGWHRYYAHEKMGRKTIVVVFDKNLEPKDFFFAAIRANKAHGIRFTAEEKKRISRRLFIQENRSAAEISQAIGCSLRHATDLIKDLAHEKKRHAIHLAKTASDQGLSERQIAKYLQDLGFKASKSGVNRWLQPEPVPTVTVKDIDAIQVSPQIGESPKRDIMTGEDEPAVLICPHCSKGIVICEDCKQVIKWSSEAIHITDSEKGSYFLCTVNDCYTKNMKKRNE